MNKNKDKEPEGIVWDIEYPFYKEPCLEGRCDRFVVQNERGYCKTFGFLPQRKDRP